MSSMNQNQLHEQLINHYRKSSLNKQKKQIKKESIIKQTYIKKSNQMDISSKLQDFLKNQLQIQIQSQPLSFRSLPRNLKVFFPGPPSPPQPLQQIPYTYQSVPKVAYKIPKQKKGQAGQWVLEESYFVTSGGKKSKEFFRKDRVVSHRDNDVGIRFRTAVKKLVKTMRDQNLSLGEIIVNKSMVKKPHNYYNSQQFFHLIKAGDLDAIRLLNDNPYLAYDVDDMKMTALHWAARSGFSELVNQLTTKFQSNALAKDRYGRTPLHLAVSKKHIECVIRIFIEGGKLASLNNAKESVRDVAPDVYTKFLLQKLQQIKFVVKAKGFKDFKIYKKQLQTHIRQALDSSSLYF